MKVVITRIVPWHPTQVRLQWDLEDVTESGTFNFNVERSGSPLGPWTVVNAAPLPDTYLFDDPLVDEEANTISLVRDIYYRVHVVPPSGALNQFWSPVVNLDGLVEYEIYPSEPGNPERPAPKDQFEAVPETGLTERQTDSDVRRRLIKRKAVRDLYLQLKHLSGTEFVLLKRRHFGTRCATCYDELVRLVAKSNCPLCYGTSWVGGFYTGVPILGKILTSPVQTQLTPQTVDDVALVRIQTLDFPRIDEGDILVELVHNRRFLVRQRYNTSLKTIIVHQTLSVSELSRVAAEFSVPVTL